MMVATTLRETLDMNVEEFIQAHIDRWGVERAEAELIAWAVKGSEADHTLPNGSRILID